LTDRPSYLAQNRLVAGKRRLRKVARAGTSLPGRVRRYCFDANNSRHFNHSGAGVEMPIPRNRPFQPLLHPLGQLRINLSQLGTMEYAFDSHPSATIFLYQAVQLLASLELWRWRNISVSGARRTPGIMENDLFRAGHQNGANTQRLRAVGVAGTFAGTDNCTRVLHSPCRGR
jgi:hypothetical protein